MDPGSLKALDELEISGVEFGALEAQTSQNLNF